MNRLKGLLLCAALLLCLIGISAQTPEWAWATQAGGTDYDYGVAIATDTQGNQYVTGYFSGTATFGSTTLSTYGSWDIFTAKLDSNGNFLWAVQAGGTSDDQGYSIAVDNAANIYITGYFRGTASFGSTTLSDNGMFQTYVAKLDTNGNFLWAVQGGGTGDDAGYGIVADNVYGIYLTGCFYYTATFGSTTLTSGFYVDIFTAKLDSNGNWLWAKGAGGSYADIGYGICLDSSGNCYVTGSFEGDASFDSTILTGVGNTEIFVAKYSATGSLLWVRRAGGILLDRGTSIAVDEAGDSFITGYFNGNADFGTDTLVNTGTNHDIFIAKLDSNGNWLWARNAGGSDWNDVGTALAIDATGNCLVTGYFYFAADFGPFNLVAAAENDIFIAKLDPAGNWIWAQSAGWNADELSHGIAIDQDNNICLTGFFWGETRFGEISITSNGGYDVFVAKLSSEVPVNDDLAPVMSGLSILSDAYPNPLHQGETAIIKTNIADRESGTLSLFNLRGQCISTQQISPGEQQISLDSRDLPAGVYIYQLKTQTTKISKKLVLLK